MKMSTISDLIGQRIRSIRTKRGLSQEKLAETAGLHPTYIGQLERGEKNATLESIEKVADALDVSLSSLFENISAKKDRDERNIPAECYELLAGKTKEDQEQLFSILSSIDRYKNG